MRLAILCVLMQVRLCAGAAFVDEISPTETVQPQQRCNRVRLVAGNQMRIAVAGCRCRLEAAVTPAGVDVEIIQRGFIDDR